MIVRTRQLIFTFFVALACFALPLQAEEAPDKADTRILIDISGSMKKNDPKNLRRSALRLMVGLMPNENRAGVWTFAQYTNMIMPLGVINESWKSRARTISEKINSPGQFTNIEEVIRKASSDWENSKGNYRKNMVLLTDGMVDVSKNKKKNAESRKRILEELGPKIKSYGGIIHTIALSDRADHELMKELAKMTGGWYEQVNDADELQRVFLRMFEKVGKPDTVPLQGNKFKLDESIDEATLLVFSAPGAEPARVMSPSGKVYDANQLPKNVSWHRDEGYDLITIHNPEAGEWTIEAAMDPDNRVMVVTNLKMKTSDIPNRLALGESVPVTVHFTEQDKMITRKAFIDVVNVSASQFFRGVASEARPLHDDGNDPDEKEDDGKFSVILGEGLDEGKVELIINADGKTFVRERRQATQIVQPAKLEVDDDLASTTATFKVHLDTDVVEDGTEVIEAWVEDMQGNRTPIEFNKSPDGALEGMLDKQTIFGRQFAVINVSGKTVSGNDFYFQPQTVDVDGLSEPPPAEPEPAPEPEVAPEPAPEPEPEQAPEPEPVAEEPIPEPEEVAEEKAEEETDWVTIGLVIGLGNLVLILLGAGIWWFMRKRAADDDELAMFEDEDEASSTESKDSESAEDKPKESAEAKAEPDSEDDEFDLEVDDDSKTSEADETIDISAEDKK